MTATGAAAIVGWGVAMACVVGYALSMLAIWLRSRAASR